MQQTGSRRAAVPRLATGSSHWTSAPIGSRFAFQDQISRWSPSRAVVPTEILPISLFRYSKPSMGHPIKPNPFPPSIPLTPSHPAHALDSPSLYFYPFAPTMPDASKPIQKGAPSHLVALPSLSNSLSSLPQAKSLAQISVYTSSMSGQHAAESEAKVCPTSPSPSPHTAHRTPHTPTPPSHPSSVPCSGLTELPSFLA